MEFAQFGFRPCVTVDDFAGVARLRHGVYCVERQWLPPTQSGLELDNYEIFAKSFLAEDLSKGEIIGTVRMVYNNPLGFPFEETTALPQDLLNRNTSYEVTRLAVAPEYRASQYGSGILIGLCRQVWRQAKIEGKETWLAIIDKPVARLLKRLGFQYLWEGEAHFHMGSDSVPILCDMKQSESVLFREDINVLLAKQIEQL